MLDLVFWLWAPSLLTAIAVLGLLIERHDRRRAQAHHRTPAE